MKMTTRNHQNADTNTGINTDIVLTGVPPANISGATLRGTENPTRRMLPDQPELAVLLAIEPDTMMSGKITWNRKATFVATNLWRRGTRGITFRLLTRKAAKSTNVKNVRRYHVNV